MSDLMLEKLIRFLKTALVGVRSSDALRDRLHHPDGLPDKRLSVLASEALDLLSDIRLELEPGHLILADHFMGMDHCHHANSRH